jgi:L-fuconolactonase
MNLNRRDFIATAGALVMTQTVLDASGVLADDTAKPDQLPIVDTHQHLWDLTKFKLNWLDGAPAVLKRSYVMQDYRQATAGLNVVRAVYMEVDVDPAEQTAEAEHLLAICRAGKSPTVGAVISGRPNSTAFRDYILKYKDTPQIKGVRQVLHAPEAKPGLCLEPQFVRSVQLLGEIGKTFDLCMRPTELADGARLVDQCRGTKFILDHCGNADPKAFLSDAARGAERPDHTADSWRRDMTELAKRENVVCKISGIVARAPQGDWKSEILAPIINHCLDVFGPNRVVFGGDWPVCLLGATYRRWVEALHEVIRARPLEQQRKLLHDNAVKLYEIGNL